MHSNNRYVPIIEAITGNNATNCVSYRISESHIRWVITVPAIWPDESKLFMREAAFKVRFYQHSFLPQAITTNVVSSAGPFGKHQTFSFPKKPLKILMWFCCIYNMCANQQVFDESYAPMYNMYYYKIAFI